MITKSLWPRSSAVARIMRSLPTNSSAGISALPAMWPHRFGMTWSSMRAEAADGERVAAEVHGVEAVIHHELRAQRVVDARPKHVWLGREEPPQPLAGILVSRRRDFVTLR